MKGRGCPAGTRCACPNCDGRHCTRCVLGLTHDTCVADCSVCCTLPAEDGGDDVPVMMYVRDALSPCESCDERERHASWCAEEQELVRYRGAELEAVLAYAAHHWRSLGPEARRAFLLRVAELDPSGMRRLISEEADDLPR